MDRKRKGRSVCLLNERKVQVWLLGYCRRHRACKSRVSTSTSNRIYETGRDATRNL